MKYAVYVVMEDGSGDWMVDDNGDVISFIVLEEAQMAVDSVHDYNPANTALIQPYPG